jgi:cytochrome c-type biogenesis protein CcmH/NrfG
MLLDQKRTKRTVQIVAILTSLAFAGVIFVVLGLIVFGGGSSPQGDLLDDARAQVERNPNSAAAYDDLAAAYAANERLTEAVDAAEKAVELEPASYQRIQTLISIQIRAGQTGSAITTLQDFTRDNSEHAEAFLQLGQLADQSGRTDLAGLAYQRFVTLAPDDPTAEDVRNRLADLRAGTATTTP